MKRPSPAATILCLAMAFGACRRDASPTVFLDPALSVLVPPDTVLLAGVRMQRLQANQSVASVVARSPRLLQFRKDMGLPATSDVWEYLISFNGSGWLVLMRGKFTEMGMEPRLDKPGATRINHHGVTVIGDERGAVAFLNPTTAIAGRIDDVIRTLDVRNNNAGVPARLEKLTAQIPSRYDVWFASEGMAPQFVEAQGVKSARGGFSLADRRYDLFVEADSGKQSIKDAPIPDSMAAWILGSAPTSEVPSPGH